MLLSYLGRRFALAVIALFGIVLTTFLVAHSVPVDPLTTVISESATRSPSIRAAFVKRWGLDRSLPQQFSAYITNVVRGDLGESFTTRRPVLQDLKQFLPATIELALAALVVGMGLGVPLGVWAAVRHNHLVDHAARAVSLLGVTVPPFWAGLILLYVFYYQLEWAPGPGRLDAFQTMPPRVTGFLFVDCLAAGNQALFWSALRHLMLPALVLGWVIMGLIARITRASLLEVLQADYVRTARSKGLREDLVVGIHALRNAMIPVITVVGLSFAGLLSGAVLTETVFAWPGIGRYAVMASTRQDYPAILGVTMLTAALYIAVNFVVDVLYGVLDPRIRIR